MKVTIITDSASDLTRQEAETLGIQMVPLKTVIDGETYLDGCDLTPGEFYRRLRDSVSLPTTSQPAPGEFEACYKKALEDDGEAVVITISSALSGTFQSAQLAAESYEGRVFPVDSENATVGEQVLVRYALRLREEGRTAREIADALNAIKSRVCLIGRVDTLEYLQKGGRISKTAAIVGGVLNVKPVLGVKDGVLVPLGKARGAKMSHNLLNEIIEQRGGVDFSLPCCLSYSGGDDRLLRDYIDNSRTIWENRTEHLTICEIGSTIGTHVGPGAVVVAFFAKTV